MILEVDKINTFYGSSHILFDVSFEVNSGEVVGILGRNGAGKTTILKSIMGIASVRSGDIRFQGKNIRGRQSYYIARSGIGYVPEERLIFPDLTVLENLQMGLKRGRKPIFKEIYDLFPILKVRENQNAGMFSGGEQQMLTIARTLMGQPELLLIDEPFEGLAPLVVADVKEGMKHLKNTGITILLSEQNLNLVQELADRCYIIEKGHIRWTGNVHNLNERPDLLQQYLGV